nr:hypothetical protein [Nitrospirota bacterium]
MPVEVGVRSGNMIEVVNGLTGTEQVIVSGKDLVGEETPIQTRPADPTPAAGAPPEQAPQTAPTDKPVKRE